MFAVTMTGRFEPLTHLLLSSGTRLSLVQPDWFFKAAYWKTLCLSIMPTCSVHSDISNVVSLTRGPLGAPDGLALSQAGCDAGSWVQDGREHTFLH